MISRRADRMIVELLDDPMVQLIMQADHVDRQAVTVEFRALAHQLESSKGRSWAASLSWVNRDHALSNEARSAARAAATSKAGPAICGACCA